MAKITFVGAGSTVFARNLLSDLLTFPELHGSVVSLHDIDPVRLADTEAIARGMVARAGAATVIEATTDRRRALAGSDYVITMIQVGGYRPSTVIDFEIPTRFGLRQTIGDTLGIGGIMRALRTIPVMREIAADIAEVAPNALLLNYANPMAMLCMALAQTSSVRTVGLCHSVQGTAGEIALWLGLPEDEITHTCAGINHVAFYTELRHRGEDLYPALRKMAEARTYPAWEEVRFEVFRRFGYFVTESSEHLAEYVPWFIKPGLDGLITRFGVPLDEYPARCENQIAGWAAERDRLLASVQDGEPFAGHAEAVLSGSDERRLAVAARRDPQAAASWRAALIARKRARLGGHSGEYGTLIIHSMETGEPRVIHGNVPNAGLIANLPSGCAVEVACRVDGDGIQPTVVGDLPIQLAALMQTNVNVQQLTVEASLTGRRDHVYHAAMLDPHTAAVLDPEQICQLVDALLEAHGSMIPPLA